MKALRRWWCRLSTGHYAVLSFDADAKAMRLSCASCGWSSPGITTNGATPRRRYDGDPRRHQISRLHISRRRTA